MKHKKTWGFAAGILFILLAINIQVPYYINQPGSAVPLAPMIKVEGGLNDEKGSFRLTTVRTGPTNVAGYLYAMLDRNADLVEASLVHSPHESDEQYLQRQIEIMKASQDTAKIVAFQKSGFDIKLSNNGAIIMQLIPGYPAEKVLQIGDIVTAVDGKKIYTAADLIESLKGRKVNDQVVITYMRGQQVQNAELKLQPLPVEDEEGLKKPGIGVASPITNRVFELPKKVNVQSENIGGPSAGLMFTLEIINQLTEGDLTKGYNIAGTGTINEDGAIGRIGGIQHKIVAAYREGVEIFFAPAEKDEDGVSNYDEALKKADQMDIKMKIVPVLTIDDALQYLERLDARKEADSLKHGSAFFFEPSHGRIMIV